MVQNIAKTKVDVIRNDEFELESINKYDKIILSPGPGIPDEAGKLKDVISHYASKKSILGVCLGMQAIAEVFGGKLSNLESVYHGVSTKIKINNSNDRLFSELPDYITVGRYHSWVVDSSSLPHCFETTATDKSGHIMALSHKVFDVKGVQFHPESLLTPMGEKIIRNWIGNIEIIDLILPTANSGIFQINQVKSGLLFC